MSCEKCKDCLKYFNSGSTGGYNCAETVIYGTTKYLGIKNKLIPRIATPFGGGLGRNGFICGALVAGTMVLGIVLGRDSMNEERDPSYKAVNKLVQKFKRKYKSLDCNDITNLDLKKIAPTDDAKVKIHESICKPLVEKVCEWVLEVVESKK